MDHTRGQRLSLRDLRHTVTIYLILLLSTHAGVTSTQGTSFYPFGPSVGDDLHPPADDACLLPYHRDIPLFEVIYSVLHVCTNGIISLNGTYTTFTPTSFPLQTGVGIIATFWADADLSQNGSLWARETNDTVLLHNISTIISDSYRTRFTATWALVVTWEDVVAYGNIQANSTNSYQCVVASDDNRKTYVQYLYGDIDWTFGSASNGVPAQVGFDAGDGINYYAVPGSQTSNISDIGLNSNVGGSGQWLFRLDSATVVIPDLNATFPPVTTTTINSLMSTAPSTTSTDSATSSAQTSTRTASATTSAATSISTATTEKTTINQPTTSLITTTKEGTTSGSATDEPTGNGLGDSDAQRSVTNNNETSQQATISGSVVGFLFILLAVVGAMFAFKKWKKNKITDSWNDAESVDRADECTSTAPVYHVWPSDLSFVTEKKRYQKVEPITAKTKPTERWTNDLVSKESVKISPQAVVKTECVPDEVISNAPRNHIWPYDLSTVITVEQINSEKTEDGIPLSSAPAKNVTFNLLQTSQQKKNSSDADKKQQQVDSYSGLGANVVKKKPPRSLPPIKKTAAQAKPSGKSKQGGTAKTIKQANNLYGNKPKQK